MPLLSPQRQRKYVRFSFELNYKYKFLEQTWSSYLVSLVQYYYIMLSATVHVAPAGNLHGFLEI